MATDPPHNRSPRLPAGDRPGFHERPVTREIPVILRGRGTYRRRVPTFAARGRRFHPVSTDDEGGGGGGGGGGHAVEDWRSSSWLLRGRRAAPEVIISGQSFRIPPA